MSAAMLAGVNICGEFYSGDSEKGALKEETHAARWGLMRGYSGTATKWVDFVMTDSTRRESCHLLNVTGLGDEVKRESLWNIESEFRRAVRFDREALFSLSGAKYSKNER